MIKVTRSSMPPFEEYCEEIKKLWESHWLTNMGVEHEQFRKELEERLNCPHVMLYTNGHLALENVLSAMQFPKGAEAITTPFTFASTTHAIVRSGLTPVFCDVDPHDYTIDASKIESLITEKTAVIVPVHVYGNLCDVERIDAIAQKYGLKVVYDAAHAFGVTYKGVSSANFGDAAMFSFHATKVFNTIEGGAVCYADDSLSDVLHAMRNFGICPTDQVEYVGGNAKMSEFQAAMGICNLRHLDEEIEKRRHVVERYRRNLSGIEGIVLNKTKAHTTENYAYFPVIFDGFRTDRNRIYAALKENDIMARRYFYPITNSFACYRDLPTFGTEKTPIAAYLSDRVLTLPLYADLPLEQVDRICDIVLNTK